MATSTSTKTKSKSRKKSTSKSTSAENTYTISQINILANSKYVLEKYGFYLNTVLNKFISSLPTIPPTELRKIMADTVMNFYSTNFITDRSSLPTLIGGNTQPTLTILSNFMHTLEDTFNTSTSTFSYSFNTVEIDKNRSMYTITVVQ